jgi:uncharacterized protein YndB with AHSA1/START domain
VQLDFTTEIDRPVEAVFAYLSDPDRLHEWDARVVRVEQETDGPLGVGTRLRATRKVLGGQVEQLVEVTEYEPPHRFSLRIVSGPIPLDASNLLQRTEGHTKLRFHGEGEPRGFARAVGPLLRIMLERQMRRHYARLRDNLESS